MESLLEYRIPIKGLSTGIHSFEYQVGSQFFASFEHSPIKEAKLQVNMRLEKKPSLYVLEFDFSGTVRTNCDRCLAEIDLPIAGKDRLLVKVSEKTESEDPEVVYLHPEAQKLEVAEYIYEFVILAIPMIKVYDCEGAENPACDFDMLDKLDPVDEDEDQADSGNNPIWDELKKFNSKQ